MNNPTFSKQYSVLICEFKTVQLHDCPNSIRREAVRRAAAAGEELCMNYLKRHPRDAAMDLALRRFVGMKTWYAENGFSADYISQIIRLHEGLAQLARGIHEHSLGDTLIDS